MKLSFLLKPWLNIALSDVDIHNVCNDSRMVQSNDLFLAYPGSATDGRNYIEHARQAGAVVIVYDPIHFPESVRLPDDICCVAFPHLSHFLAPIACRFYQDPSQSLTVTGVTGTNGKTTVAYQLTQAHRLLGQQSRYIGTLGQGAIDALVPLVNTTPDALCLQKLCREYVSKNVQQVCMEVSSHALCERRVDEIHFNQAIFTNLTQDHLDYHQNMQAYAEAKSRLFAYPSLQTMIINQDDPYASLMIKKKKTSCRTLTYGMHHASDVRVTQCEFDLLGSTADVISPWGTHRLLLKGVGQFNIYNGLAVFTSLMAHGYAIDDVVQVMHQVEPSPGRLELVAKKPCVLVDYAHTPDALENVLKTLSQLKHQARVSGRLWVVFGCGGDRDRTKRPMMGKIAEQWADQVILTSDNPRSENPEAILSDIVTGLSKPERVYTIVDRKDAIERALSMADECDIVLVAGKGHESYQQIGQKKFPFSDQEVIRDYLIKPLEPDHC